MPDPPTSGPLDQIRSTGSTDDSCTIDKEKRYEVQLEPEDDPERLSLLRRWLAVATIAISAHFVTFVSSAVRFRHQLRVYSTLMSPFPRQCSPWAAYRTAFMLDEKSPS